jgi:branched-subunit amino acid transport protein
MSVWLVMLAAGVVTYSIRLSLIILFSSQEIPTLIQRTLRFIPPAVLTAIIFPELFIQAGKIEFSWNNLRLVAGLVAIVVAWRTRNAVLTVIIGLATLWVLQALIK